jgi:hypothetical protein
MNYIKSTPVIIGMCLFILASCGNNNQDVANKTTSLQTEESSVQKIEGLPSEFIGNYHGIQPSYFMKNQYGDDMIINGNKVSVPSSDFKFLIKENNVVSLQQTNLDDNSRYYYDGTIKILNDDAEYIKVECSLSDGKSSNPTYTLTINKSDKSATCIGHNEPEIKLEKIK